MNPSIRKSEQTTDRINGKAAQASRLARIGLELYSVRDAMQRDPDRTLAQVHAIGYDDVALLWSFAAGFPPTNPMATAC